MVFPKQAYQNGNHGSSNGEEVEGLAEERVAIMGHVVAAGVSDAKAPV